MDDALTGLSFVVGFSGIDVAHFGASTFVDIRIKTFILSRTAQTKSTRIKQI